MLVEPAVAGLTVVLESIAAVAEASVKVESESDHQTSVIVGLPGQANGVE